MIIIDYDIIILEDMNNILYKNQDNNQNILAKFLSVTDGLLSKDTKIIISTNIESRSQINEALMRPGRSFNTIHFRKLKVEEVKALADSYNKKMNLRPMNISEFYANVNNEQNNKIINNTTGF
jgi:ATP-dependent 26S proteasome regulatory subunit